MSRGSLWLKIFFDTAEVSSIVACADDPIGLLSILKLLAFDGSEKCHALSTCYWNSVSPLEGHLNLELVYPNLKEFFTEKLGVKTLRPINLVRDIVEMAKQQIPNIPALRSLLIDAGRVLTTEDIDSDTLEALDDLRKLKFLPKRSRDGKVGLVGISDSFAIQDHVRYSKAFAGYGILLDFDVSETQIMHPLFRLLQLDSRYLSNSVVEQSSILEEGI